MTADSCRSTSCRWGSGTAFSHDHALTHQDWGWRLKMEVAWCDRNWLITCTWTLNPLPRATKLEDFERKVGRFCKPNPVRFSERFASVFASRFWPGRFKVHTNMCEPWRKFQCSLFQRSLAWPHDREVSGSGTPRKRPWSDVIHLGPSPDQ